MHTMREAKGHADCSGTHGVRVHPCPVILKKTKYVAVSASGPGIYEESWGPKPCQPFCKFAKVELNEFKIYPDRKCGTATVVIYGYNAIDQRPRLAVPGDRGVSSCGADQSDYLHSA
jgi:hypothetical protein